MKKKNDLFHIYLISEDDDSPFLSQVYSFVNHGDANYLELNVALIVLSGKQRG